MAKRHSKHRDAPDGFLEFIRHERCIADGPDCKYRCRKHADEEDTLEWVSVVAHRKTRGSSGNDYGNTFPACVLHHGEQEDHTDADFEMKYEYRLATNGHLPTLKEICLTVANNFKERGQWTRSKQVGTAK